MRCAGLTDDADVVVRRIGDAFTIRTPAGVVDAVIGDPGVEPTNLACAVAAALEIGVDLDTIRRGLARLHSPEHRCTVAESDGGVFVIDDTFSSNMEGSERALRVLAETGNARRFVVTPGIVELGSRQYDENKALGEAAGKVADTVVIVGATNRAALRSGTRQANCETLEVRHREDAVTVVRARAARGDTVLYENDLPDHYP